MKRMKEFYIITNKNEVKNKNLDLIFNLIYLEGNKKDRVNFQLWKKIFKTIGISLEEKMISEELVIVEDLMIIKKSSKLIFDKIFMERCIYDEITIEERELKYKDKFYIVILPLLSEEAFNENNVNIKNGYSLLDLSGNYKMFRILKDSKILNIVDEEIKNMISKFNFKNIDFQKII